MRRRVVKILTLVSAVVCVGSGLLVGRSFFYLDVVHAPVLQEGGIVIATFDGRMGIEHVWWEDEWYLSSHAALPTRHYGKGTRVDITSGSWFEFSRGRSWISFPLWPVPILTAVLPVWWWVRRRRGAGRGFAVGGR